MVKERQKFEIRIFSYLPNPRIWKTTITSRLSGVNLDIIGTSPESIKDWLWDFNARKLTKKDIADEEKVVADMVADAKKTCKVLGFKEESEKFADCTLKLYTQKVDELVAKKVEANTRMMQSQTTTQQSSGSNTMTIYDPVRDNQRMINQGMKMLSGKCTLGVDC